MKVHKILRYSQKAMKNLLLWHQHMSTWHKLVMHQYTPSWCQIWARPCYYKWCKRLFSFTHLLLSILLFDESTNVGHHLYLAGITFIHSISACRATARFSVHQHQQAIGKASTSNNSHQGRQDCSKEEEDYTRTEKRFQRKPRTKKVSEDLYSFREIVSEDFWEIVSEDNFWELVSHDNFWELVSHDNFCSFVNATAFGK